MTTELLPPTFVHLFRTLVYYQKNVLRTLVMKNKEKEVEKEKDMLNTSVSDTDSTNETNDSIFQYFDRQIDEVGGNCKINILCTHITHNDSNKTGIRFPFIQYLLEKKVFHYNQLELPSIVIDKNSVLKEEGEYEKMVVDYILKLYRSIYPNAPTLSVDNCYVGSCYLGDNAEIYALLDVSNIWSDIHYMGMSTSNRAWFGLSSEIINTRNVCGISVNEKTSRFFAEYPELSKLNSIPQNQVYPIPDVGYTTSPDILSARVACMFGPPKVNSETIITTKNEEITEPNSIKTGFSFSPSVADVMFKKNNSNVGALTRYAVFYPEEDGENEEDNVLVCDYDMFLPMTYHILNKTNRGIL